MKWVISALLVFFLFLPAVFNYSLAQQQPLMANVIPPSPNAASLGMYGDIPVSQYTGVPNISIPIYEVKTHSLSLPISLDYHASGIKVAQEASWVGLGWSLNAGGVITRTVRGLDDFSDLITTQQGFYSNSNLPPSDPYGNGVSLADYFDDYGDLYNGRRDPEPDLFYYNFGNYAGKMIYYPPTNSFVSLNVNNLKIEYVNNSGSWIFTTPDGNKYIFHTREISTNYSLSSDSYYDDQGGANNFHSPPYINQLQPQTVNSWYLDSVVSPLHDYIVFSYDSIAQQIASQISRSQTSYRMTDFSIISTGGGGYITPTMGGSYNYYYANQQVTDEICVKQIRTSEGLKIDFATSDRLDLEALDLHKAQKLSTITISHNLSTHASKNFNFYYSYINDYGSYYKNRRLRLDSVSNSSSGITVPAYSFSYYDFIPFPPKDSRQVDHWGYFNWATGNEDSSGWGGGGTFGILIPTYHVPGTFTSYTGADRNPNASTAMINTLIQINYPTGGYTKFDYELNDYNTIDSISLQYHEYKVTASYIPGDTINRLNQQVAFSLSKPTLVTLSYNAYSPDHPKTCTGSNVVVHYNDMDGLNYAVIQREDATPPYAVQLLKYNDWNIMCPNPTSENSQDVILPAGNYTLQTFTTTGFRTMARVYYTDSLIVAPYNKTVKGGGLRVKSIISSEGQTLNKKFYRYTASKNGGLASSGVLMSPLVYFFNEGVVQSRYIINTGNVVSVSYEGTFVCGQSSPVVPLGSSASGNSIGYDQVTELRDTGGVSGKTVYQFINVPEQQQLSYPFYPNLPNTISNRNGLLSYTAYYSSDTLIKSIASNYISDGIRQGVVRGLKMYSLPFPLSSSGMPGPQPMPQLIKFYNNNIEWWKKVEDSTLIYSDSGVLNTVSYYEYDTTNLMVNKHITNASNGKTLTELTSYAHNHPSETLTSSTVMDAMKNAYMVGLPVKEEKYVNSIRTAGKITNYGTNLLPTGVALLEGSSFNNKLLFDSYDANGNPIQYHELNNLNTSSIWGYNKSKPVIIAKDMPYYVLEAGISQVLINLGYTSGITQLDTFLNALGDVSTSTQKTLLHNFIQGIQNYTSWGNNRLLTVYTHDLLDGLTSATDQRGKTTFYEYDSLGRLKLIRDQDGNVIKTLNYHYKQ